MQDLIKDLFKLSSPWWHFPLRALIIYGMVMVLLRMSGKRAVGQFTPFDLALLILIGNAVQNGLNGGDNSITGALILVVCLIVFNYVIAFFTSRFRRFEQIVEGVPVILARNGVVFHDLLRKELISEDDFREALRMNNVKNLEDVGMAILETNGSISVVTRDVAQEPDAETTAPEIAEDERNTVPDQAEGVERQPLPPPSGVQPRRPKRRRRRPGSPEAN